MSIEMGDNCFVEYSSVTDQSFNTFTVQLLISHSTLSHYAHVCRQKVKKCTWLVLQH